MVRIPTHRAPTHPGEMLLKEFLEPLEITQTEAANTLGISYVRLNEIINGHRGVTPNTALRLERAFGIEAQFWLNLQLAFDLFSELHSKQAGEIRKIRRVAMRHLRSDRVRA